MTFTFDEQADLAYAVRSFPMPEDEQERLVDGIISGHLSAADMSVVRTGLDKLAGLLRNALEGDHERVENHVYWASMKAVARAKEAMDRQNG